MVTEPTDLTLDLIAEGDRLAAEQDYAGAEEAYREIIRLDPAIPYAHTGLACALMDAGQYAEAEVGFRAAIRLDAHNPYVHNNLGLLLCRLERQSEAQAEFRVAVSLDPTFVAAQINLAEVSQDLAEYEPYQPGLFVAWFAERWNRRMSE